MSADQAEHGHQVSEREARQVAEEAREARLDPAELRQAAVSR